MALKLLWIGIFASHVEFQKAVEIFGQLEAKLTGPF